MLDFNFRSSPPLSRKYISRSLPSKNERGPLGENTIGHICPWNCVKSLSTAAESLKAKGLASMICTQSLCIWSKLMGDVFLVVPPLNLHAKSVRSEKFVREREK